MKKVLLACLLICVLLSCCSCGYSQQSVSVNGWQHTSQNPVVFELGLYDVKFQRGDDIIFAVRNKKAFEKSLQNHSQFVDVQQFDYFPNEKAVYVFLQSGNFYLVIENGDNYILRPAVSRIFVDGDMYLFPLYGYHLWYDCAFLFNESNGVQDGFFINETTKDWQFFVEFYSQLGQGQVEIDLENKRFLVATALCDDAGNTTPTERLVSLRFVSSEQGNYLFAKLI